ncbi:LamG-like jellyroll fold domain-containing protein [Actinoplanes sp. NPDC049548]|uniref:LamG-like jellyroll fold domain-containing protein n=1 Tax=Actinoplanes sp. NPDC049548 TaxID=3155152 RepID=UPI00343A7BB7
MVVLRSLHPALLSAVLVPAVVAGLAVGSPAAAALPPAQADPATETAAPTPAESASRQARETGQPVEVVAERAEDELLWANPDGSFTSQITAGPQRVRQADGTWSAIDTTLVRHPDGSIGPRAAAVDLAFSGGGTGDLIRLAEDGKALAYGWPGTLPAPELAGDTATYAEVLPGVDLKVSASSVGYSYVMVVKSAQAAANPALANLALSVRGEGVTIRESESGGVAAVDGAGEVVFEGAQPSMWDSAGTAAPAPAKSSKARSAASEPAVAAQSGPEPVDESAAPSAGDRVADVDVRLSAGALTLVPDAELLTGPATVYPVYIDPDETVKRTDWMYVSSAHASTEYYKFDDDEGVGRCSNWGGYVCSGSPYTNRMYFKFTPVKADWADRVVSKAVFRVYETWSFSCTASWVDLNLVDAGKVNSGTNWNNKPTDGDLMVDRKVAYGRGKSCDPDAPASWVEFADNKDESNENLTPTVRTKLKDGAPIALSLNAHDEGDGNSWKRFRGDNASLEVTFNTKPGKPYDEQTTSPTTGCVRGASRPFIRDATPQLQVTAADDEKSQNLKVTFEVQDLADTSKNAYSVKIDPQSQQGKFYAPVPAGKLKHGHSYRWHAFSNDGAVDGPDSDWCELSIDLEEPSVPPVVTSDDFPAEGRGKPVGQSGVFTFAAGANKDSVYGNDVDYYKWSLTTDVPTNTVNNAALGGTGTTPPVTPTSFGPNVLYVQSYDRAGNPSEIFRYVFRPTRACDDPAADTCAAGVWKLDETTGTTAADSSGKGHPLTVTAATRAPGQLGAADPADQALHLDGTSGFASGAAVVDSRQGVTVSAWVRPTNFAHNGTVLSQAGTYGNGFALGYSSAAKRWVFGRHKADKANPAATDLVQATAATTEAPELNRWTYLTGVFDPADNTLRIYVDGKEQGTAKYTGTIWNGASSLQVGRARSNDKWVDLFAGDVDDVRVFAGVLDPADIDGLWFASRPPVA